jgi:hypothetical protein
MRLWPEDRELLQTLGEGEADRYSALCSLTEIVKGLKLPDIRKRKRRPLRLGVPVELDAAIDKVVQATGQTRLDVLLAAAREYRRRHPK